MHHTSHALIGSAASIPSTTPTPILSFSPLTLTIPNRPAPLDIRITFPATGTSPLPVVLLSHGHGRSNYLSSLEGYAPVYEFLAARGFIVIQPTHLTSRFLGLPDADGNMFFDTRTKDMSDIIDRLDEIESAVPSLQGRVNKTRIAVVGHSFGGITASMLLGMTNTDPRTGTVTNHKDTRISTGVILTAPGNGGSDISPNGSKMVPWYGPNFATMTPRALTIAGDDDASPHLSVRDASWHADPYTLAPAAPSGSDSEERKSSLIMVKDGKHGLGGISGWDAGETLDEGPERLGMVLRMMEAWLRAELYGEGKAWEGACEALRGLEKLGTVESR